MPDKLIYDRTAADVARVNELMRKVRAGSATDAEREEWLGGGMKGAWNASDLNRINDWLAYLTDFLEAQGYSAAVFFAAFFLYLSSSFCNFSISSPWFLIVVRSEFNSSFSISTGYKASTRLIKSPNIFI